MKIPKGLNGRAKIVYSKKSMKIPKGLNRRAKIVYIRRV
jgi:hypothetical protein